MRSPGTLLALPTTLLTLLLCHTSYALDVREDTLLKRDQDALSRLAVQQPNGVRKMSDDPGEKFWPHYWQFEDDRLVQLNATALDLPLALHYDFSLSQRGRSGRTIFARDAACPTGTSSCASLGYPDSCCPADNTCIKVPDTGNGPVGCCAAGKTCGNTVPDCNTSLGYSACPNSSNKGCCIPGYACSGNICVNVGTQYLTPTTSTTTTTTSSSTTANTAVVIISVVTVTNVNTSGFTTTATVTATVTQSGSSTTSSDTAVAPVRPTTNSDTTAIVPALVVTSTSTSTSTVTTTTSTATGSICPTGYYRCSAVYLGGCCQVDRDCHTTSCPPTASTTVIDGQPTVIAPTGATSNARSCAIGWYSCPSSVGGDCCPNGYSCGQTDCPASISGVAAANKQAPNEATGVALAWTYIVLAVTTALGMVML